ncbi:MAG: (deoxy)nucleoside triphosphate pyrophosphohydrolase [Acidobacteria bacterium]|nr:(deoxy)nucleoside triphosphate pyrophosphohydrolase [Acidobacteriota bacterium]
MPDSITVVAAVVERDGAFLVTRRLDGTHLAGMWEFPGGKCDPGESHGACLAREMREELAVEIRVREKILGVAYDYPERSIALHFYRCDLAGEPVPQLGQQMQWAPRAALRDLDMPPADADVIELLSR